MVGRKGAGPYRQPRAIVAAASRVPLNKPPSRKPKPSAWQTDARTSAEIPELKQLIRWRGNQLAKLNLYAASLPLDAGPDAEPVPVIDEATGIPEAQGRLAMEILAGIRSRIGGQAEILRRLETNLSKVGEAWVVYLAPKDPNDEGQGGEPEEWTVCSISEIEYKNEHYMVRRSPGIPDEKARVLADGVDDLFRVWEPDDEWFDLPDCALRGCIPEAETLALLAAQIQAEARSGTPALIFCVPNELSFGATTPTDPDEDPDGEPEDPFQKELESHLDSAGDPTSRKTLIPLLLRGPGEHMKPDVLRTIDLSRKPDGTVDARVESTLMRLARGMDAPVEVVKGLDSTTFANAKQVSEDTWEQFLQPRAVFLVDAITVGAYRALLIDAGIPEETANRIFVWFDARALIAQPDQEANADGAYDRNEISGEAYRRVKGFDDADAPEALEILVRTALRRGQLASPFVLAFLEQMAQEGGVTLPTLEELTAGAASGTSTGQASVRQLATLLMLAEQAGHLSRVPGSSVPLARVLARTTSSSVTPGQQLAGIDRELRTRLTVVANDALVRALEKAGSRLRGRAGPSRATLRNVPARLCASTLGPALVADTGLTDHDLLAGAFDSIEREFTVLTTLAQADALAIISRVVGGLSDAAREITEIRQAGDLAAAWPILRDSLVRLAERRLYDPDPAAPLEGEFDPTLSVPPGLIRRSLAMAGGPEGLVGSGQDDGLLFRSGGVEPAGGVATGETIRATLAAAGGRIDGWVWEYGPALRQRPFGPHLDLDGMAFEVFDDSDLANLEPFPEYRFFIPGDHPGCVCNVIPTLLGPDGTGPELDPFGRGPNVALPPEPAPVDRAAAPPASQP